MADGTVEYLAGEALHSLANKDIREAASRCGALDDVIRIEETLLAMIEAGVGGAERRQEDYYSEVVEDWLGRLRRVLNQANALFDRLEQQRMEKGMLYKVGVFFSMFGPLGYNRKLADNIKFVREQLDAVKSGMVGLNLSILAQEHLMVEYRETSSVVYTGIIGRDNDAKIIIEMLFDSKYDVENITVIPIVGFGGVGKTTLAQLVFNNQEVQNHFDLTAWVHGPQEDDLEAIMRNILVAFTHENHQDQSLDSIQQNIIDLIKNKKYLLVLDDVWTDKREDVEALLNLLNQGEKGSKVIVTTRSHSVAWRIGSIEAPYKLGTLSDSQSWELFRGWAFPTGQDYNRSKLSTIGKDIVKMCGNVPLAIKAVAVSLRSNYTERDWLLVKDGLSKAILAQCHDIMAVLRLSYDHLSPGSKCCFAYCSLFPKGYEFKRDELVHLWMAQKNREHFNPDMVDLYLQDLVAQNLFQGTNDFDYVDIRVYKMHDLLHDLAQHVAGKESMILGYEPPNLICDQLVHVNLDGSTFPPSLKDVISRLESLLNLQYTVSDEIFLPKFQSLHALSMKIFYKKLPDSIGSLIALRYLKIEGNAIECLPESITRLVNLQTLNLKSCFLLKELPRDFCYKLINLRHLFLPYDNLTDLPPRFDNLIYLQELNRFIVGEGNGIHALRAKECRGELDIELCRWRRDAIEEAKMPNLRRYPQLTSITLHLKFEGEESTPAADDMNEMLRCLQLPPNLESLTFWNYKGYRFPGSWLDGLSKLVSIKIFGCKSGIVDPYLSRRPHLKSLELCFLDELEYVEDYFSVDTATHNQWFQSLEVLVLKSCDKLKAWAPLYFGSFQLCPSLLKMVVHECPMLLSMPLAPNLESLEVWNVNGKMVESYLTSNHREEVPSSSSASPPSSTVLSLKELDLPRVDKELNSSPIGSSLSNLSILRVVGCSELENLRFESPNSIRELYIQDCSRLNISEGLQHLSAFEKLYIKGCPHLAKRLMPPYGEDHRIIQQIPNVYIHDGSKTYIRGRHD